MSDRIGVMSAQGIIEQLDTADMLYNEPKTAFVADFVGDNNALPGIVSEVTPGYAMVETACGPLKCRNTQGLSSGQQTIAFVRPEAIAVQGEAVGGIGLRLGEDVHHRSAELGFWLGEDLWAEV